MKNWFDPLVTGLHIWSLLGVLLLPFPFYLIDFQQYIAPALFDGVISGVNQFITGSPAEPTDFTSDAPDLYRLMAVLGLFSTVLMIILFSQKHLLRYRQNLMAVCRVVCCYYLSLQLLKYGFDKVFKAQFYLPEPNILYTPAGQLSRDILFWTTMGTSRSYNIFMGLTEVIPAVLLLFRRTRVLGLIMAAAVLLQVVMINYSYGITVQLFSTFLLSLSLLLLMPFSRKLHVFLVQEKSAALPLHQWDLPFFEPFFVKVAVKSFIIGIVFSEALYPCLSQWNFNDDLAPRPEMHGAYEVLQMTGQNGDTIAQPLPFCSPAGLPDFSG